MNAFEREELGTLFCRATDMSFRYGRVVDSRTVDNHALSRLEDSVSEARREFWQALYSLPIQPGEQPHN